MKVLCRRGGRIARDGILIHKYLVGEVERVKYFQCWTYVRSKQLWWGFPEARRGLQFAVCSMQYLLPSTE